jgi:lysophospholipase L1-like esterase
MASVGQATVLSRLNQGDNLTVAAIGTSLTASATGSWFGQMGAWLDSQYPHQLSYHNDAVPSSASKYTSSYTYPASGLDVQLGTALTQNPDVVFIEFAMNDAYTAYGITPQMSKDNLQAMIDRINTWSAGHGKPVDIIVQTTNNEPNTGARPNLSAYYQGYRDVATANGLLLIDHEPNWVNLYNTNRTLWGGYVPDGIHPNALGTENIILPEIERALLAQTPEPSTLVLSGAAIMACGVYRLWSRRDRVISHGVGVLGIGRMRCGARAMQRCR